MTDEMSLKGWIGGGRSAYLLMCPSFISRVFIWERRSGSRVAGV
jgi:hypothetical protein